MGYVIPFSEGAILKLWKSRCKSKTPTFWVCLNFFCDSSKFAGEKTAFYLTEMAVGEHVGFSDPNGCFLGQWFLDLPEARTATVSVIQMKQCKLPASCNDESPLMVP